MFRNSQQSAIQPKDRGQDRVRDRHADNMLLVLYVVFTTETNVSRWRGVALFVVVFTGRGGWRRLNLPLLTFVSGCRGV